MNKSRSGCKRPARQRQDERKKQMTTDLQFVVVDTDESVRHSIEALAREYRAAAHALSLCPHPALREWLTATRNKLEAASLKYPMMEWRAACALSK